MSFATLKMNGNPTSQMFQCLHFPEGGEDICVAGFLPSQKNYLLSWWISGKGTQYVTDQITAPRALECLYSVRIRRNILSILPYKF